ncbi:MAG: Gfo/Idh/MocA family oxidoreductase [Candidatus Omnitrophota bacterium]
MSEHNFSRRIFLLGSAAGLAGCSTVPSLKRMGYKSPNEKLNCAAIGAGGKGESDIGPCKGENVVALCDPDWRQAARSFRNFPDAKKYKDFREMLDKEKTLDAVTVSTPDNVHAVAAMACIKRGLHVYVQKPLTHDIYEARMLKEAARKYGVATQMGNQGHSEEGIRVCCELIWAGAIGNVREVHAWTNRPIWPQGIPNMLDAEPIPEDDEGKPSIDWDVWLGPAPYRPFNHAYAPFNWRGWYDFGCGALGDMACHILDAPNWALMLSGGPTSVECIKIEGRNKQTFPNKSIIKFEFPARGSMCALDLYWYDGGLLPPRPADIPEDVRLGEGDNGSLFIGDKGYLTTGTYAGGTRLLPKELDDAWKGKAPKVLTRAPGNNHHQDWLRACKGGEPAGSNFDYAAPYTEWILAGSISTRFEGKLEYNAEKMRFTNNKEANQYVKRQYRKGWSLNM